MNQNPGLHITHAVNKNEPHPSFVLSSNSFNKKDTLFRLATKQHSWQKSVSFLVFLQNDTS